MSNFLFNFNPEGTPTMSMKYLCELVESNTKSIAEMIANAVKQGAVTVTDINDALLKETAPVPAEGDIYNLSETSNILLHKLQQTEDRDMLIIVKKILRSTKYAAVTWYAVTGADNNPHHLPVQPIVAHTA